MYENRWRVRFFFPRPKNVIDFFRRNIFARKKKRTKKKKKKFTYEIKPFYIISPRNVVAYCIMYLFVAFTCSTCVSRCPPRSFPNKGGVCWPCHESCETCAGAGQDSCLTCAPAHLRVTDLAVCLQQCPDGYFESESIPVY